MGYQPGSPKAKLGDDGEWVVRQWLKSRGFYILPASQLRAAGAPMLQGCEEDVVLPDDLVCRKGVAQWVETKTKSTATFYHKAKRWEHGFPLHQWESYLRVEELSGIPGWLAILELSSSSILLAPLRALIDTAREYHGDAMPDGRPHIFLDRAAFKQYFIRDLMLPGPIRPQAIRTLEQAEPPSLAEELVMDKMFNGSTRRGY